MTAGRIRPLGSHHQPRRITNGRILLTALLAALGVVVHRLLSLGTSLGHDDSAIIQRPERRQRPPPERSPQKHKAPIRVSEKVEVPTLPPRSLTDIAAVAPLLENLRDRFDFLQKILLNNIQPRPLHSDVVELRHCRLHEIDYHNFTTWADIILDDAYPNFAGKLKVQSVEVRGLSEFAWNEVMIPEFTLELLEVYATHNGLCDFREYPLRIAYDLETSAGTILRRVPASSSLADVARLAIIIVAFKDAAHLKRLIKALHLPHHLVVIHLERTTSDEFREEVIEIASAYQNVAICQFGTVTYRTDSVSFINYQIMNWLVNELQLSFDYLLTLGGAVYPLYNAAALAKHLGRESSQPVWLGELKHNGLLLTDDTHTQWDYLQRKRLIFTSGETKYQQRTKKTNQNGFVAKISSEIQTSMTRKTNSGNQGVFSYSVVQELTTSPHVKELFAIAKYGCCCCLEERTWIAAATLIGYKKEALQNASMFQVWGGEADCQSSMSNALLTQNASTCFRYEDATSEVNNNRTEEAIYFRGNETRQELLRAKARGFMFARKFKSDDDESMNLLKWIQETLHKE